MFLEWLNILSIVIYAEKRFLNLNNLNNLNSWKPIITGNPLFDAPRKPLVFLYIYLII